MGRGEERSEQLFPVIAVVLLPVFPPLDSTPSPFCMPSLSPSFHLKCLSPLFTICISKFYQFLTGPTQKAPFLFFSKMWNASHFCMPSLHECHANLLCIPPTLAHVLLRRAQRPFFSTDLPISPTPKLKGQSHSRNPARLYFFLSYDLLICHVSLQLAYKVNICPIGFCPNNPRQCCMVSCAGTVFNRLYSVDE